jgi:hypothetical protein
LFAVSERTGFRKFRLIKPRLHRLTEAIFSRRLRLHCGIERTITSGANKSDVDKSIRPIFKSVKANNTQAGIFVTRQIDVKETTRSCGGVSRSLPMGISSFSIAQLMFSSVSFRSAAKSISTDAGSTSIPANCFEVRLLVQQEPENKSS